MFSDENGTAQEPPVEAPRTGWAKVEDELKVHEMPPEQRLATFDKWRTETGNRLLAEGAFDKPENVLKWKEKVLRQKRRLADDFMMEPDPRFVQKDMAAWQDAVSAELDPTPEEQGIYRKLQTGEKKAARIGNRIEVGL